jgi:hypothetical protein
VFFRSKVATPVCPKDRSVPVQILSDAGDSLAKLPGKTRFDNPLKAGFSATGKRGDRHSYLLAADGAGCGFWLMYFPHFF